MTVYWYTVYRKLAIHFYTSPVNFQAFMLIVVDTMVKAAFTSTSATAVI